MIEDKLIHSFTKQFLNIPHALSDSQVIKTDKVPAFMELTF